MHGVRIKRGGGTRPDDTPATSLATGKVPPPALGHPRNRMPTGQMRTGPPSDRGALGAPWQRGQRDRGTTLRGPTRSEGEYVP